MLLHDDQGALDRFAQFFAAPLFNASSVARELHAVDAEHQKNVESDGWRLNQLQKHLSDPRHPFNRFSTGNLFTLNRTGVRDSLISFHKEHYAAQVMCLVVVGRETVGELETWVNTLFGGIPYKKGVSPPSFQGAPPSPFPLLPRGGGGNTVGGDGDGGDGDAGYDGGPYLGRIIRLVPIKDKNVITLMWPLPSLLPHFRSASTGYLGHLIGHEGAGSILSVLRQRGLAHSLSAGTGVSSGRFSLFEVKVGLTKKGQDQGIREVLTTIFAYLQLLRRTHGGTHGGTREDSEDGKDSGGGRGGGGTGVAPGLEDNNDDIAGVAGIAGGVAVNQWDEWIALARLQYRFKEQSSNVADYSSFLASKYSLMDSCCGGGREGREGREGGAAGGGGGGGDDGGGGVSFHADEFVVEKDLLGSPERKVRAGHLPRDICQPLSTSINLCVFARLRVCAVVRWVCVYVER